MSYLLTRETILFSPNKMSDQYFLLDHTITGESVSWTLNGLNSQLRFSAHHFQGSSFVNAIVKQTFWPDQPLKPHSWRTVITCGPNMTEMNYGIVIERGNQTEKKIFFSINTLLFFTEQPARKIYFFQLALAKNKTFCFLFANKLSGNKLHFWLGLVQSWTSSELGISLELKHLKLPEQFWLSK